MELNELASYVSTLGAPLICLWGLFTFFKSESKDNREERKAWIEAINNNTSVIRALYDLLSDQRDGGER